MVFLHENDKCQNVKKKTKQKHLYLHLGRYDFLLFGNTNNEWGHKKCFLCDDLTLMSYMCVFINLYRGGDRSVQ